MASCCSSSFKAEARQTATCPCCSRPATAVGKTTLLHHVVAPLNRQLAPDKYFFCASANCNTVYFSNGGELIETDQVRWAVGQKSTNPDRTLCYCFDINHARVMEEINNTGHCSSKAFVVEQTRLKNCACDIRNPSGQCCLKTFPK